MAAAPVGIFGGTFDPIHFGHLRPALEVREGLGLAEVRFVPCHVPPHRGQPQAHADHRLELLQAAIADVPYLRVDQRELERSGPSYTVDTLIDLRQELPDSPLCLMIGMDSLLNLPKWHRWQELIELAHIVVMARPGYAPTYSAELAAWVERHRTDSALELKTVLAGAVYFYPVTQMAISATAIRDLIANGRAPRFLTPDAVWRQILAQRLYGWPGQEFHSQPPSGGHDQG